MPIRVSVHTETKKILGVKLINLGQKTPPFFRPSLFTKKSVNFLGENLSQNHKYINVKTTQFYNVILETVFVVHQFFIICVLLYILAEKLGDIYFFVQLV